MSRLFCNFARLPFANKEKGKKVALDALGQLATAPLVKELRIKPKGCGALTLPELRAVCTGLMENKSINLLDLDSNMIAYGMPDDQDPAECLRPLIDMLSKNKHITSLDISNNGLPFNEESMQVALESLIRDTGITGLNIGGSNLGVDDALLSRISEVVARSRRRWRFLSSGGAVSFETQDLLNKAIAGATRDAEGAAIKSFFGRGRSAKAQPAKARSPDKENADPTVKAQSKSASKSSPAPLVQSRSTKRPSPRTEKAEAAAEAAALKRQRLATSTATASATKAAAVAASSTTEAAEEAEASCAPSGEDTRAQPALASDSRCEAFTTAFNIVREREAKEHLDKTFVLKECGEVTKFSGEEMEYYLWCMQEMNWVMLSQGRVYIV